MTEEHVPAVVVGAGPYGLSVSAHLSARGVEHRVFGRPMSMWAENMPRGMFLKSEGFASDLSDPAGRLTLRQHCTAQGRDYADVGAPVAVETFVAYGRSFQEQLAPHLEQRDVVSVARAGSRFRVGLSDGGEVRADRVVLAVGNGPFGYVPPALRDLPGDLATHSSAHRDFSRFAGRDVTVVGGGQGALESAALLHEAGAQVRVLVRGPAVRWNNDPVRRTVPERLRYPVSPLGTGWDLSLYARWPAGFRRLPAGRRVALVKDVLGPAGAWWLRDRVVDRFPVLCGSAVTSARATGGQVELRVSTGAASTTVRTDHVVAATGYRVDLAALPFLERSLREDVSTLAGSPVLSPSFESSVPGLFWVGLAAATTFGPVQRFVCGARVPATRVSRALARSPRGG